MQGGDGLCRGGKAQRRKLRLNTEEGSWEQVFTSTADLTEVKQNLLLTNHWGLGAICYCYCHLIFQQRVHMLPVGLGRVETGGWHKAPPELSISYSCGTQHMRPLTVQGPWRVWSQVAMDRELKFSQATTLERSKTPALWETPIPGVWEQNHIWSYVIPWFYIYLFIQ